MVVCKRCGAELPDGSAFCTECGYRVTPVGQAGDRYTGFNASTGGRQAGESTGAYGSSSGSGSGYREAYSAGRPEDSLPVLAEGEMTVKTYVAAELKRPRGTGYLTVTNKRLIFHGRASRSLVSKEVALDSVSGLECFIGINYIIPLIIFGSLLFLAGVVVLANAAQERRVEFVALLLGAAALLGGASMVASGAMRSCTIRVFSSKTVGSPIEFGRGMASLNGNRAVLFQVCAATRETKTMVRELGALVTDLQTMGDAAIGKWKR